MPMELSGTQKDPEVPMVTCPDGLETSSTLTHVCLIHAPARNSKCLSYFIFEGRNGTYWLSELGRSHWILL
jgi:hypothetical protein